MVPALADDDALEIFAKSIYSALDYHKIFKFTFWVVGIQRDLFIV
jgi:hypothetical protein